ncbi:TetR/AcrR family transcriptional regulator [Ferrimonas sediminicola]|uniref:TetR/AcrR family transcriptional regulator n=1 Tax=Ferrimonas sediminicola TaxID=2569538 RepID=A0A4V5NYL2_9GAMM|nr:TetR/AcrR family transcriptional regulator [Ferrimonas sediminicola]TKB50503.1 TetR/AcrR family transcriptional regulator [Ferrimonas sediminicola]
MEQELERDLIDRGVLVDPSSARGKLLTQAARLFRENGYQSTTVRDLASAVGILSGSIFHHYKNKDAILKAVMVEGIHHTMARMRRDLQRAQGTTAKLRALIACELDALNGDWGDAMAVVINEWRFLSDGGQQDILALRDEYERMWLDLLVQAEKERLITASPKVLRKLLYGAITWTDKWFDAKGELSSDQLTDAVLHLAIKPASDP